MRFASLSCLLVLSLALLNSSHVRAEDSDGPQLIHNVFFALHESTPENRAKLVAACHTLKDISGIVYFAVGDLAEDIRNPVNVLDFDVSLTIVFENKQAHDEYQVDEVHVKFVEENRPTFKAVRVYDTYLK